jgi:hypothetical protein
MGGGSVATGLLSFVSPSGDTTGASDSAAILLGLAGNGSVFLTPGTFYINTTILVDTDQTLAGWGNSTVIRPGSGAFTGSYMVALRTPATTVRATIRDLILVMNYAAIGGVQLDNTGYTDPGGLLGLTDTLHTVENVLTVKAGGDGFHFDNNIRELRCRGCKAYNGLGYGFFLGNSGGAGSGCTDSHFTDCTLGNSVNHGWNILDGNNMFTSCKAFGAGFNAQTSTYGSTQAGFEITGTHNVFVGCSAQQNALYGFDLQGTTHVGITGCEADSNGAGAGPPTGVGINLNGCSDCSITSNVGNQSITPGNQVYGIQQAGTANGTYYAFNTAKGTLNTFNFVSGHGYYLLDGLSETDFTAMRDVRLGSPQLYEVGSTTGGAPQTLVNGSTVLWSAGGGTYAVTSAANVTGIIIAAPAQPVDFGGAIMTVLNSGSFTVTFAASGTSNVADGVADVIPALQAATFIWDTFSGLWYRAY